MSTITYANIQPVTEADFIRRDLQYMLLQQLYIIKTTRVLLQENSLSRSLSMMNIEQLEPFDKDYEIVHDVNDDLEDKHAPYQQLMVPYSSEIEQVLTIMTTISPDITTIPWLSVLHLDVCAGICLGDIFELASFLPALRTLKARSMLTHKSVTHVGECDYELCENFSFEELLDDLENDECIDMSRYEAWLRSTFMPLQGSLVTAVLLTHNCRTSAQVLLSTERLCNWFFPQVRDVTVEGIVHTRINGEWNCTEGFCRMHTDH